MWHSAMPGAGDLGERRDLWEASGREVLQQPGRDAAAGERWSRLLSAARFPHRVTRLIPSSRPSKAGGIRIPQIFTVPALCERGSSFASADGPLLKHQNKPSGRATVSNYFPA